MKLWDPLFKSIVRASLVVQWLRIHLAMQETWVRSLVWEDLTCHRQLSPHATTTEPVCLSLYSSTTEARVLQLESSPQMQQ